MGISCGISVPPNPKSTVSLDAVENHKPELTRRNSSRVYLLDVQPLCYRKGKPNSWEFVWWIEPFLTKIVSDNPVVAVFDGRSGNEFRKKLLPSYKAGRPEYKPEYKEGLEAVFRIVHGFFRECDIPVVQIDDAEADDVVATLAEKTVDKDLLAVIASPDKDFKQLLCDRVQLLIPLHDLRRWSFYTVNDYISQRKFDPAAELGLRKSFDPLFFTSSLFAGCMLGDAVDGVPGVPGFGRKTAVKLMKKYGTLENLLGAAAIRAVGRPYIQEALRDHASLLDTNLQVLRLRRNLEVTFPEEACTFTRDRSNDRAALSHLKHQLNQLNHKRG